jgi:hypothetical protein
LQECIQKGKSMFDSRNIEIESGQLSIGLDNLFDNIDESEKIFLYVKYPEIIQMFHDKKKFVLRSMRKTSMF